MTNQEENQKENCRKLINRWRELRTKLPIAQSGKSFKFSHISSEERDELSKITKKIKERYLDSEFLTSDEKYDIKYTNLC